MSIRRQAVIVNACIIIALVVEYSKGISLIAVASTGLLLLSLVNFIFLSRSRK